MEEGMEPLMPLAGSDLERGRARGGERQRGNSLHKDRLQAGQHSTNRRNNPEGGGHGGEGIQKLNSCRLSRITHMSRSVHLAPHVIAYNYTSRASL